MKDTIRIFHCFQQGVQTVVLVGDDRIHLLRRRKNISVAGWTSENENRHNSSFTDGLVDRLSRESLRSFDELHSASSSRLPTDVRERFIVEGDDGVKQFLRITLQKTSRMP